jgi:hypothetical protein
MIMVVAVVGECLLDLYVRVCRDFWCERSSAMLLLVISLQSNMLFDILYYT